MAEASARLSASRSSASRRTELTEDEKRELTRLYTETDTPIVEIARRFEIGKGTVYRVATRNGAKLRGTASNRQRSSTSQDASTRPSARTPVRRPRAAGASGTRGPAGRARRNGTQRGVSSAAPTASAGQPCRSAFGSGRFRVRALFEEERLLEVRSMRELVEQLETLAAQDVTVITLER